jgi:hypothetical protein
MHPSQPTHPRIDPRERGSVYILVLGASMLVAAIGISSLMAVRVQRRTITITADQIQAREMARTGVDRLMHAVEGAPNSWRNFLENKTFDPILVFDSDTQTLLDAVDPVDGNLTDDTVNPVVVTSTGKSGGAVYTLEVTLNGDGSMQPGTWKRVVN